MRSGKRQLDSAGVGAQAMVCLCVLNVMQLPISDIFERLLLPRGVIKHDMP
jgi:hypothetical protein